MEQSKFLLTRPLRDVTRSVRGTVPQDPFLLTRPLRDVTVFRKNSKSNRTFLLTRPLRDVTETAEQPQPDTAISTHTPLAGRDDFQSFETV